MSPEHDSYRVLQARYIISEVFRGTHAVTCCIAISFGPESAEVRLEHESTPALTLKMMRLLCVYLWHETAGG